MNLRCMYSTRQRVTVCYYSSVSVCVVGTHGSENKKALSPECLNVRNLKCTLNLDGKA